MKKFKIFGVALALLITFISCKQDNIYPISKDETLPEPVKNVQVENLPGGARITYDLPQSKNLLYVKAVFTISEGNKREVKASYYKNSLIVEGFPDSSEYKGKLYTVSRSEKESEPVSVTIKPLTPPVIDVFKTISMQATFGGVRVNFENKSEADVVLTVLAADSLGDLVPATRYYTQRREGSFAARGFPAEQTEFAVFVKDRWDNHSDTVLTTLTPLFEEELDKANFAEVHLPTDTYERHCCGDGMINVWDGIREQQYTVFHTKPNTGMPQWFTFDLGVKARLSRFKFHHRPDPGGASGAYSGGDPMEFEIWGSNDPASDGSWDSWTKLGTFTSMMPSGGAMPTSEDIQYAVVEGEDFEFPNPEDAPAVRYLRFKTNSTWGGVTYVYIAELTFWGAKE